MRTLLMATCIALASCGEPRPQIQSTPAQVEPGSPITVSFDRPVQGRAVDQYWLVVAPVGSPDSYADNRLEVARLATSLRVVAPLAPGAYEVRLHGDFPRKPYNVVHKVPLVVTQPRVTTR